jgi:hypothetical protein
VAVAGDLQRSSLMTFGGSSGAKILIQGGQDVLFFIFIKEKKKNKVKYKKSIKNINIYI